MCIRDRHKAYGTDNLGRRAALLIAERDHRVNDSRDQASDGTYELERLGSPPDGVGGHGHDPPRMAQATHKDATAGEQEQGRRYRSGPSGLRCYAHELGYAEKHEHAATKAGEQAIYHRQPLGSHAYPISFH